MTPLAADFELTEEVSPEVVLLSSSELCSDVDAASTAAWVFGVLLLLLPLLLLLLLESSVKAS